MTQRSILQIGQYHLQSPLGQGSMGTVYLAFDTLHHRDVALKCIRVDKKLQLESHLRFRRGAGVASRLDHPSILRVFDYGEADGYLYVASEFLKGTDLKMVLLRKEEIEISTKLRWMREICSALAYAHQQHVIHRDIKPANIFIRLDNTAVLMDFGIARGLSPDITSSGTILGTPDYFSPEQVLVLRLDQRSDVFSLGVVFYELLTGIHPFRGKDISTTVHKILNETPAPVTGAIGEILLKAMAKAHNERYADCAEMLKDLAGI